MEAELMGINNDELCVSPKDLGVPPSNVVAFDADGAVASAALLFVEYNAAGSKCKCESASPCCLQVAGNR